jgi:hypothetical protein
MNDGTKTYVEEHFPGFIELSEGQGNETDCHNQA